MGIVRFSKCVALLLIVLYPEYHHTFDWNIQNEATDSPDRDKEASESDISFIGLAVAIIAIILMIVMCRRLNGWDCLRNNINMLRNALYEPEPRMSAPRDIHLTRTNQDRRRRHGSTSAGHAFSGPELRTTATQNIYYSELSRNNEGQTAPPSYWSATNEYEIASASTFQSPYPQNVYNSEPNRNNDYQTAFQSLLSPSDQNEIASGSTMQSPFGLNESKKKLLKSDNGEDDTTRSKQTKNKENPDGLM